MNFQTQAQANALKKKIDPNNPGAFYERNGLPAAPPKFPSFSVSTPTTALSPLASSGFLGGNTEFSGASSDLGLQAGTLSAGLFQHNEEQAPVQSASDFLFRRKAKNASGL